jgi:indolepyruvate ferredoxin oxidoreductase alpha subunit
MNRAALKTQTRFAMRITDDCVGCRDCIDAFECPAILFDEEDNRAKIDHNRCIGCGVCVHVCRTGAIKADSEVSS